MGELEDVHNGRTRRRQALPVMRSIVGMHKCRQANLARGAKENYRRNAWSMTKYDHVVVDRLSCRGQNPSYLTDD